MDFTREPIIETVITPKEGCKIVVRNSKNSAQEEFFVDAVEVVSFGNAIFYRSLERPRSFLVPATDYEILEVREARMVLKHVGVERAIKIGGGKEASVRPSKEVVEKQELPVESGVEAGLIKPEEAEIKPETRIDKKRERRRHYRRRRGREEDSKEEEAITEKVELPAPSRVEAEKEQITSEAVSPIPPMILSSLIPAPSTLISETLAHYKDNAMFRGAFFAREVEEGGAEKKVEEKEPSAYDLGMTEVQLEEPHPTKFQIVEEETKEPLQSEKIPELQEEKKTQEEEYKANSQEKHFNQNETETT